MPRNLQRMLFLLFFISGFCGLLYQVVWLRLAFAAFGVITPVISVVVSVFMLGLAIGSWMAGNSVARWKQRTHRSAIFLYAFVELMIGLGAFGVPLLFSWGADLMLPVGEINSASYLFWSAAVIVLAILPWCVCMGATYPLMMEFVRDRFERLDVLVSNAATGGFRTLMEATPRHFDAAMHTNARALVTLVQASRPLLQKSQGLAKVVAISSHGSHRALPNYALIGASKAALESLVRHLALELGTDGINFNVVLAGLVETDATRQLPGSERLFEATRELALVADRQLQAEDVANTVLYLASPLSDLVQGQTLTVDGGVDIRC